jgi:metal-responsive CopG/Arc/MetJ family transcriptional regulator
MAVREDNTRISVTVPKEIYEQLLEISEYEDRSVSNLVLFIIKLYLRSRKHSKNT